MNKQMITTERVFSIFSELNKIPRPSHHEERVADYLCQFAERLNLAYERDKENCVVIRKPASKGFEEHEPIVLLNHMDMVCVGMSDPLNTPIEPYTENGWMRARGTSLGADNGIGLSMALVCRWHWQYSKTTESSIRLWKSSQRPMKRTACRVHPS